MIFDVQSSTDDDDGSDLSTSDDTVADGIPRAMKLIIRYLKRK